MKILIATKEKQTKSNDFCWTKEDEIVTFPTFECSNSCICGCTRSWAGTQSSKSTTTAKVVQSKITVIDLAKIIYDSKVKDGWVQKDTKDDVLKLCMNDAVDIARITSCRKVGTIIRRQGIRTYNA